MDGWLEGQMIDEWIDESLMNGQCECGYLYAS